MRSHDWIPESIQRGMPAFSMKLGKRDAQFLLTSVYPSALSGSRSRTWFFREAAARLLASVELRPLDPSAGFRLALCLHAEENIAEPITSLSFCSIEYPMEAHEECRLHGISGGFSEGASARFPPKALRYSSDSLAVGGALDYDSDPSGRSSNTRIPIWLVAGAHAGIAVGPEWSGTWSVTVRRDDTRVTLGIRLPHFHARLAQGEEVALPEVDIIPYEGSHEDGFNALRRFTLNHLLPALENGRPPLPPVLFQGLSGMEAYQTEENLYREAERAARIGCEAFVLDAGWYQSPHAVSGNSPEGSSKDESWFTSLGDWKPHPERFPHGFDRFSAFVKEKGMRLGLWLEPRVNKAAAQFAEVQDVLLAPDTRRIHGPDSPFDTFSRAMFDLCLIDLGSVKGQNYFYETMGSLIERWGADFLWFDFNTMPRTIYWDTLEEPDRTGLMELRFYRGLYATLDRILRDYPGTWIETCASGGRCIDFGMLRRSHSIWISDFSAFEATGQTTDDDILRNFKSSLNRFVPAACIQSAIFIPPRYHASDELYGEVHYLRQLAGALQFGQGLCLWKDADIEQAAKHAAVFKDIRPLLEGDFFELAPLPLTKDAWDGWQFHDSAARQGILVLFRLDSYGHDMIRFHPRGLSAANEIRLEVVTGSGSITIGPDAWIVGMPAGGAVLARYSYT